MVGILEKALHSFEIINDHTLIKRMDKSLLNYGEIRIPNYLRDFFHFHEMEKHDRWDISISFRGKSYAGVLYLDNYQRMRGKIRWSKNLTSLFYQAGMRYIFPSNDEIVDPSHIPLLRLEKISSKEYKADLIFPEYISKDATEYLLHEDKFIYGVKARYETDDTIRLKVLKIHGTSCKICRFNYEETYGDLGIGYMKIHQIASEEKAEDDLDYNKDFIPICENCHGIIHRDKNKTIDYLELQQIYRLREELRKTEKS